MMRPFIRPAIRFHANRNKQKFTQQIRRLHSIPPPDKPDILLFVILFTGFLLFRKK